MKYLKLTLISILLCLSLCSLKRNSKLKTKGSEVKLKTKLYISEHMNPLTVTSIPHVNVLMFIDPTQNLENDNFVMYIVYATNMKSFRKNNNEALSDEETEKIKQNYLGEIVSGDKKIELLSGGYEYDPNAFEIREIIYPVGNCSPHLQFCFLDLNGKIVSYRFVYLKIEDEDLQSEFIYIKFDTKQINICEKTDENMQIFLNKLNIQAGEHYLELINNLANKKKTDVNDVDNTEWDASFVERFRDMVIPLLILNRVQNEKPLLTNFNKIAFDNIVQGYILGVRPLKGINKNMIIEFKGYLETLTPKPLDFTSAKQYLVDNYFKQLQIQFFDSVSKIHLAFKKSFTVGKGKLKSTFNKNKVKIGPQVQILNSIILGIIKQCKEIIQDKTFNKPGLYRTIYPSQIKSYLTALSDINNEKIIEHLNKQKDIDRNFIKQIAHIVGENLIKRVEKVEHSIKLGKEVVKIECPDCDKDLVNEIYEKYAEKLKDSKDRTITKAEELFVTNRLIEGFVFNEKEKALNNIDLDYLSLFYHTSVNDFLEKRISGEVESFTDAFQSIGNLYCPVISRG
jgi:hypothetical protein